MEKDYNVPKYSQKDFWWALGKVAIGMFFATTIYYEFRDGQSEQRADEKEFLEIRQIIVNQKEYLNERIDKKTDRNKELIDKNAKEVEKLKQPNSDKN